MSKKFGVRILSIEKYGICLSFKKVWGARYTLGARYLPKNTGLTPR
jgi:hypothetical protein